MKHRNGLAGRIPVRTKEALLQGLYAGLPMYKVGAGCSTCLRADRDVTRSLWCQRHRVYIPDSGNRAAYCPARVEHVVLYSDG